MKRTRCCCSRICTEVGKKLDSVIKSSMHDFVLKKSQKQRCHIAFAWMRHSRTDTRNVLVESHNELTSSETMRSHRTYRTLRAD